MPHARNPINQNSSADPVLGSDLAKQALRNIREGDKEEAKEDKTYSSKSSLKLDNTICTSSSKRQIAVMFLTTDKTERYVLPLHPANQLGLGT
ncbi:hypothetical protein V6N13_022010 [Hibiscus sabdariffa]|uniref:Uncharacterized protein n=2 Tax=Hibiscus sabdariffa TaxID=183260 RepID=A0ABR2CS24_9ROSI